MNLAKYFVLVSGAIGGAEKRFADIFKAQRSIGIDARIILPSILARDLFSADEMQEYGSKIVQLKMKSWNPLLFIIRFYFWILKNSNKDDVFHYPLNPLFFLHLFPRRTYILSLCDSLRYSTPPFKNRNDVMDYVAMRWARAVDVLSPHVYDKVKQVSFVNEKVSLTPAGTFVFRPSDPEFKFEITRNIVFLARLDHGKGLELLFETVKDLLAQGFFSQTGYSFKIYGKGQMKDYVERQVGLLQEAGARIQYMGYLASDQALVAADFVLSLQQLTNYPSRVVAEALLAGKRVLVLRTGNSENFGDLEGLYYVENNFQALAQKIMKLAAEGDFQKIDALKVMKQAQNRFCNLDYVRYFDGL